MPTIIDSLIVQLGLDSDQYVKKSKEVEKSSKQTEKTLKNITVASKDTSKGFNEAASSAAGFLAVIGGSFALKALVTDFATTNSAITRFSQNIGQSATTVSAWGNAAELVGGSAGGLQASMQALSTTQSNFVLKGETGMIPFFSRMGVALFDASMNARSADAIYMDLAKAMEERIGKGAISRPQANNYLLQMGMDQGTVNLILQGSKALAEEIKKQKEYNALTKEQAEQAVKLNNSIVELKQNFEAFGRVIIGEAQPVLDFLNKFADCLNRSDTSTKNLVIGFGAIGTVLTTIGASKVGLALLGSGIGIGAGVGVAEGAGAAVASGGFHGFATGAATASSASAGSTVGGGAVILGTAAAIGAGYAITHRDQWFPAVEAFLRDQYPDTTPRSSISKDTLSADNRGWWKKSWDKVFNMAYNLMPMSGNEIHAWEQTYSGPVKTSASKEYMMNYLAGSGLPKKDAAAVAANLWLESAGKSNQPQIGGGEGYGLAQWSNERQADFKAWSGRDIHGSSVDEQLNFVIFELTKGKFKAVGDELKNHPTVYGSSAVVSRYYESPRNADAKAAERGALAQLMLGVPGASVNSAMASSVPAGAGNSSTSTVNIHELKVYSAAQDAPGIAADLRQQLNSQLVFQAGTGL